MVIQLARSIDEKFKRATVGLRPTSSFLMPTDPENNSISTHPFILYHRLSKTQPTQTMASNDRSSTPEHFTNTRMPSTTQTPASECPPSPTMPHSSPYLSERDDDLEKRDQDPEQKHDDHHSTDDVTDRLHGASIKDSTVDLSPMNRAITVLGTRTLDRDSEKSPMNPNDWDHHANDTDDITDRLRSTGINNGSDDLPATSDKYALKGSSFARSGIVEYDIDTDDYDDYPPTAPKSPLCPMASQSSELAVSPYSVDHDFTKSSDNDGTTPLNSSANDDNLWAASTKTSTPADDHPHTEDPSFTSHEHTPNGDSPVSTPAVTSPGHEHAAGTAVGEGGEKKEGMMDKVAHMFGKKVEGKSEGKSEGKE